MSDRTEAYLIHDSGKARLFVIKDTGEKVWVPHSVTDEIVTRPALQEADMPGIPATIKVKSWFRQKEAEAFGE